VNRTADFFYKTNRFESIRITNRIESIRIAIWNALIDVRLRCREAATAQQRSGVLNVQRVIHRMCRRNSPPSFYLFVCLFITHDAAKTYPVDLTYYLGYKNVCPVLEWRLSSAIYLVTVVSLWCVASRPVIGWRLPPSNSTQNILSYTF